MNKKFFSKIKNNFLAFEKRRGTVVRESNLALNLSKRAIFSFHRDDYQEGVKNLAAAEKIFDQLEKLSRGVPKLRYEGSWRAALEEYAEAKLFGGYLKQKKVLEISGRQIDADIYLAALCDFTGELVRRAVKEATQKNVHEVKKIKQTIEQVMQNLIQLNLTGYLRTKYDQAKNNLRKIEEIMYEISLRS